MTPIPWAVHEVLPTLRLAATRAMPALPAALDAEIDRLWAIAQSETGGVLFNGGIFSADTITPDLVQGHWSEYRRAVAQMRRPDLFAELGVRSLAVGGVILSPDGVVFGRRPARAVYQAGEWQLPPAGSIDPTSTRGGQPDWRAQFLTELGEELGLAPEDVTALRPLCIVEHAPSHVMDLGIAATTPLTAAEIATRHATRGNGEYDPITVVPLPNLPAFLAQAGPLLNLQAPAFLRRAGVLA